MAVASSHGHVATGSKSGLLILWNVQTQTKIAEVQAHEGAVILVAFSFDGGKLITASEDGTAAIWQVPQLSFQRRLARHEQAISDASFDKDGERAVIGSYDGTVAIWKIGTNQLNELKHHPSEIIAAKFAPRSNIVLVAALNEAPKIYDPESGRVLVELKGHRGAIRHAAFSPKNERVVTSAEDGSVIIWNAATGEKLHQFEHERAPVSADLSDSEEYLVTASGRSATLWQLGSSTPIALYAGHLDLVTAVRFLPGSQEVVSAGDATMQMWQLRTKYPDLLSFARSLAPRCLSIDQMKRFGVGSNVDSWCSKKLLQLIKE
jgi:WD40 repeat protein